MWNFMNFTQTWKTLLQGMFDNIINLTPNKLFCRTVIFYCGSKDIEKVITNIALCWLSEQVLQKQTHRYILFDREDTNHCAVHLLNVQLNHQVQVTLYYNQIYETTGLITEQIS